MPTKNMIERLNWQTNREIYSAYFYLGMASYAASIGLVGVANWFKVQFKEELTHAGRIFDYVSQQKERVLLKAIEEPPQDFSSALDLFDKTLKHEKNVTKTIHDLVRLAKKENNKATEDFLQWFVKEQIEEEANASKVLQQLSAAGKDKDKLLEVDNKLAMRKG